MTFKRPLDREEAEVGNRENHSRRFGNSLYACWPYHLLSYHAEVGRFAEFHREPFARQYLHIYAQVDVVADCLSVAGVVADPGKAAGRGEERPVLTQET
jgi:hypothetical protein